MLRIPSPSEWPFAVQRYGLAVLSVSLALGGMLALEHFQLRNMSLFFVGIAMAAWYGGVRAALLALLLTSVTFDYFFLDPFHTLHTSPRSLTYLAIWILFTTVITWFSTVRHKIERELRKSREELEKEVAIRRQQASLLDLTHDTIFVRDMHDIITYWNRGAQELYGWTAHEAIGKHAHELLRTVFPIPLADLQVELLHAGRWEGELQAIKADGARVAVAARWSVRQDDRGCAVAILETHNDISEQKRREGRTHALNEELTKRTGELAASNRELEAFAYSVSHDLRAPLRHTIGYGELLQKHAASMLDEKGNRYLGSILESAKRMGNLIDDLLTFSRIGRTEARMTTVDLSSLLNEVVTELRVDAEGRDIVWRLTALPVVYGDRSMLRLVLVNLLSNAVKFTRKRPKAEIEVGCMDGNDDAVVVCVRDNGVGFNMKYASKLFGVFQRLHTQDEFEGTGIGLATVQRIISRHGGKVWAEGLTGAGAAFYFSIPRRSDKPDTRIPR